MQNTASKKRKPVFWILTSIGLLLIGLALFFIMQDHFSRPGDLGPSLQYIGKEKVGCLPFPIAFICIGDTKPYYIYYFATDMNEENLKTYFKKATYVEDPNDGGHKYILEYKTFTL